eukprot:1152620-Pelagomonas_calceolata.AAC.7
MWGAPSQPAIFFLTVCFISSAVVLQRPPVISVRGAPIWTFEFQILGQTGAHFGPLWWESMGGSFLNAHGRTASANLSFKKRTSLFLAVLAYNVSLAEAIVCLYSTKINLLGSRLEMSIRSGKNLMPSSGVQGVDITLHSAPLGVGGTIYTAHTLDKLKQLGIDPQRSTKLAQKLHAHSVQHAHKVTSTRRAIEVKNTRYNSGAWGQMLPETT